jgi:hypothetical protein
MPRTRVAFYQEADGEAPVVNWLRELLKTNERAWSNCRARIGLLAQSGHEYELRAKQGHVQYRLLYFFHGREVAILAHSLRKEEKIPVVDIERTIKRKKLFEANPKAHTYESKN